MICGALRDLVAFAQFKKRAKHPWRSVNFSKDRTCKAVNVMDGINFYDNFFRLTKNLPPFLTP